MPPENKLNKKNIGKFILIGLFIITAIYLISYNNKNVTEEPLGKPIENNNTVNFEPTEVKLVYGYDSNASFYTYNSDDFYFCTKDGLKYMTKDGEEKWAQVYTMTDPVMSGNCENVIVYEPESNMIYVFSPEGLLYEKQLSGTVQSASINKNGMASVIVKTETGYETSVFDQTGQEITKLIHENKNIYPIASDISDDGTILAITLIDINGIDIQSTIEFYFLDERANDYQDSMFGGLNMKEQKDQPTQDQFVANLMFLDNNNLISFSDVAMNLINIDENNIVSIVLTIPLNNKIDHIAQNGSKGFAIALGEGLTETALPEGTVEIYNSSLVKIDEYQAGGKINYLFGDEDTISVGSGRTFSAINLNGKLLWRYNALESYNQVLPIGDYVLFAGNTEATVMKEGKKTPK